MKLNDLINYKEFNEEYLISLINYVTYSSKLDARDKLKELEKVKVFS